MGTSFLDLNKADLGEVGLEQRFATVSESLDESIQLEADSAASVVDSSRDFDRVLKRQLDVVAAALLILLGSPVLLAVAIAIKLTDGGPIFFRQLRVGKKGRTFWLPKFRSMVPNADTMIQQVVSENHHGDSITFKMKQDPRITSVGRIIRRFSVDEIPQLWCVLRGDMSLVGPRPALPREVANYNQHQLRRLLVAPGLTCIWQVSGRADVAFDRQVEMDLEYIEKRSFALDVKLLFRTVPAVLSGRGAY